MVQESPSLLPGLCIMPVWAVLLQRSKTLAKPSGCSYVVRMRLIEEKPTREHSLGHAAQITPPDICSKG